MERDSFVFYKSFYEAVKKVTDPLERALCYDAICEFAIYGKEVELTGVADIIFPLMKPQIEANNKRYLNGLQPKVKQKESKTKAKSKQSKSKTHANDNENVNVNVNVNVNENEKKEKRHTLAFGEFKHVKLTQEEFDILSSSVNDVNLLISFLDEYLEINPKKKYANHFLVLKNKFPMEEYKNKYPFENVIKPSKDTKDEIEDEKEDEIDEEELMEMIRVWD